MTLGAIYNNYRKDCDKGRVHNYISTYEKLFSPKRESAERVLEIGVRWGASICMWRNYFPNAEVVGMDIDLGRMYPQYRIDGITLIEGDCAEMVCEGPWDIVIDDGPHDIDNQLRTINEYYPLLNEGGMIIIEDIQEDSYLRRFKELPYDVEIIDLRINGNRVRDDILVVVRK